MKFAYFVKIRVVIVPICYSSPWTVLSSLVTSEGVTDLLASYDLFLLSGQKTTTVSYMNNVTAFTCGVRSSISGNCFVLRSRYVSGLY
jgi:hypothetical protein